MTLTIDIDPLLEQTHTTIPWEQFVEALTESVNERGREWVYPGDWMFHPDDDGEDGQCLYVKPEGDGPACLIGMALVKCGVALDWLSTQEGRPGAQVCRDAGVEGVLAGNEKTAMNPRGLAIINAQQAQDGGSPWGTAHVKFFETLRPQEV